MAWYEVGNLLISLAALAVSIWVHRRQLRLEEERRAEERERAVRGNLSCQLVRGERRHSYRVEIMNHGPTPARNVMLAFEGTNPLVPSEMENLPIERIPAGASVRFIAAPTLDTPPPFHAVVTWLDPDGTEREERFTLTLP